MVSKQKNICIPTVYTPTPFSDIKQLIFYSFTQVPSQTTSPAEFASLFMQIRVVDFSNRQKESPFHDDVWFP